MKIIVSQFLALRLGQARRFLAHPGKFVAEHFLPFLRAIEHFQSPGQFDSAARPRRARTKMSAAIPAPTSEPIRA